MFDAALIESAVRHGDGRTARSLPLAVGFHAAVLGALVLSALASTGEPPEPVIPIAFPSFQGGPPPPPEGGPRPIPVVVAPRAADVHAPAVRIPENAPDPDLDAPADADGGDLGPGGSPSGAGQPGGEPGGVREGVPGGTGTTDDPGLGKGDEEILRPGVGGVTIPELLERVEPAYPEPARKLRQEGMVILEAVITASGIVDEVRVVASAGPLLDAAALSAVRRWRYRPATLNGRTVAVLLTVIVKFGLSG